MSKQREALELALEALQWNWGGEPLPTLEIEAIEALKRALAEPEPARKPLTDEDISAIVQSMSAYTWDAHMLARAIERAHGIGE